MLIYLTIMWRNILTITYFNVLICVISVRYTPIPPCEDGQNGESNPIFNFLFFFIYPKFD